MKNKSMQALKQKSKLIALLCIVIIFVLYFILKSTNYSVDYEINGVKVIENYLKKEKYYKFELKYDDYTFEVMSFHKYIPKRKLINKIKIKENSEGVCLNLYSKKLDLYNICANDHGNYTPFINDNVKFKTNEEVENIKISNLNEKNYFLWNYKEFVFLNNKGSKLIKLFDKDIYKFSLIYQTDNYLLLPDYDSEFKFDKMYLISKKNGKVKEINLRYELYFDSYFLGNYKDKVYLFDKKNEQEYYIDIKKKDIYQTDFKIYENNNWQKVSIQKLKNKKLSFSDNNIFIYKLENDKLYGQIKESKNQFLVTNTKVTKIVKIDNLDVYYLVKDTLYYFNPEVGNVPLLKYSEWEFNNDNMIFIF